MQFPQIFQVHFDATVYLPLHRIPTVFYWILSKWIQIGFTGKTLTSLSCLLNQFEPSFAL